MRCRWLGRRRGWMLVTQAALLVSIPLFGVPAPAADIWTIAYLAAAVAFFSASSGHRARRLSPRDSCPMPSWPRQRRSTSTRTGSRASCPASLALILADRLPWSAVFIITALFMLPGIAMTLLVSEPRAQRRRRARWREAVVEPFHEFVTRAGLAAGAADARVHLPLQARATAWPPRSPRRSTSTWDSPRRDIGIVAKNAGLWASVIGGMLGGLWMVKIGINRGLWLFGVVQMVSILGFAWLAQLGQPDRVLLGVRHRRSRRWAWASAPSRSSRSSRAPPIRATRRPSSRCSPACRRAADGGQRLDRLDRGARPAGSTSFCCARVLALPGMALLLRVAPWHERAKERARP